RGVCRGAVRPVRPAPLRAERRPGHDLPGRRGARWPSERRADMSASETMATAAPPLRLGTRRSPLATTQSTHVADALRALGHEVELVPIVTEGDVSRAALSTLGGTGVFAA